MDKSLKWGIGESWTHAGKVERIEYINMTVIYSSLGCIVIKETKKPQ